jgi:hypothetical protein
VLLDLVNKYQKIIKSWAVDQFEAEGPHVRLKGRVVFTDGSVLFFRQIILDGSTFKYAYHWQETKGNLICRWDNAPHWPDIATHPHHKHIVLKGKEQVLESRGGDLEEILKEISKKIPG